MFPIEKVFKALDPRNLYNAIIHDYVWAPDEEEENEDQ